MVALPYLFNDPTLGVPFFQVWPKYLDDNFAALAVASGVVSFSGSATGLTPSAPATGDIVLSGTLAVAHGGTGVTTSTGSTSVVLSHAPTIDTPTFTSTSAFGGPAVLNDTATFNAGILSQGTPRLATIIGYSAPGNIWLQNTAIAQSATLNEIGGSSVILSSLGFAAGVEKTGWTSAAIGTPGTGPIVGHQVIGYGPAGLGGVPVFGERISFANNGIDASAISANSAWGLALISEGSTNPTGFIAFLDPGLVAARPAYGIVVDGDVITTTEWFTASSAPTLYQDFGTHTNGFDLSGGTYSGKPIITPGFFIGNTGAVSPGAFTVATLPGTPTVGLIARVTDGTAGLVNGNIVTGGHSTPYLVWYNGANWTVLGT